LLRARAFVQSSNFSSPFSPAKRSENFQPGENKNRILNISRLILEKTCFVSVRSSRFSVKTRRAALAGGKLKFEL
jgi:hypothetical protein